MQTTFRIVVWVLWMMGSQETTFSMCLQSVKPLQYFQIIIQIYIIAEIKQQLKLERILRILFFKCSISMLKHQSPLNRTVSVNIFYSKWFGVYLHRRHTSLSPVLERFRRMFVAGVQLTHRHIWNASRSHVRSRDLGRKRVQKGIARAIQFLYITTI